MNAIWAKNLLEMNTELCFTLRIPRYKNIEINLIAKDVYNLFIN